MLNEVNTTPSARPPLLGEEGRCTTKPAPIERPYSSGPQPVGAVYDRAGFVVQSREDGKSRWERRP
jgi:hypothetical protein